MKFWTLTSLNATVGRGPCEIVNAPDLLTLLNPKPFAERVIVGHIIQLDGPHQSASINLFQSFAPRFISMWHGTWSLRCAEL
jgi:hypothetical protein